MQQLSRGIRLKKYPGLEALRGISIIFIVLDHIIKSPPLDPAYHSLQTILEATVPIWLGIFLFVSGFLIRESLIEKKTTWNQFLRKRAFRLLVPYAIFAILYTSLIPVTPVMLEELLHLIVIDEVGVVWFLKMLFVHSVLMLPFSWLIEKNKLFALLAPASYVVFGHWAIYFSALTLGYVYPRNWFRALTESLPHIFKNTTLQTIGGLAFAWFLVHPFFTPGYWEYESLGVYTDFWVIVLSFTITLIPTFIFTSTIAMFNSTREWNR